MGLADTFSKVFKRSNIGTMIFFILNFLLILAVFYPYSTTTQGVAVFLVFYILSILLSLSPLGEWTLSVFAGAKEMKRKDMQIRMIPLLEVVYSRAKKESPNMVGSIRLKVLPWAEPNAYALGRRTICVTEGLFDLSDELIMGVLAHEVGHIAERHSEIQLLIGGANIIIWGFLLMLKLIAWTITGIFGLFAIGSRRLASGCLIGLIGSVSTLLVYFWTKFCMLFLMWSARSNEFAADEYAYRLGFGNQLAYVLDNTVETKPNNSFLKLLKALHKYQYIISL